MRVNTMTSLSKNLDYVILSRTMQLHRWDWYTLDPQTYAYQSARRDQKTIDRLVRKLRGEGWNKEVDELYKKYRDTYKRKGY